MQVAAHSALHGPLTALGAGRPAGMHAMRQHGISGMHTVRTHTVERVVRDNVRTAVGSVDDDCS